LIDLSGRRVLVTGGSRGIGAACCRLFARAGASVLVHCQAREDLAAALIEELSGLPGPFAVPPPGSPAASGPQGQDRRHLTRRCDLRDAAEIGAMFAFVAEQWGRLDVLVNNAGIWVPNPLTDLDPAALAETLAVNVTGSFLCAAAAVPLLAAATAGGGDASIVNLTSTAGQRGEPRYSPYAASKGAMIAATRSWAVELAPRVRVNAVAPGWVDTDMTATALAGEGRSQALAEIPLGRIATAEDIAGPVVFLASPLARHVTGEVLNVNGGSVLC
jgi:3-oxoacyl-[acyl-carrier protein] reductase